ncbi:phosphoglucosamine mutase [Bacteroidales bacterium OttesenSCG-928-B11]|nr:phosphoglucosamine mutase [Bacteroidales bacterium OttesenSCG-928-C03]MDL2311579.1 phosphoglucosamine mutase [Bacteroidales bacterium OttesenSCG-928-B11]MDL2326992.1 phosphoglucosamine mutase [Bacteroidales bacterium OttesenSCG-928-A14]
MTLIKSISGIRGTIGGKSGENLTPVDIIKFTSAFVVFLKEKKQEKPLTLVVGRDARISGDMVNKLVCGTLQSLGVNILDVGLSTTPTVEMTVIQQKADGGIILTASHNPIQWNALKLLNDKGEFISNSDAQRLLELSENEDIEFAEVRQLGQYTQMDDAIDRHIDAILALNLVDADAVRQANFSIIADCVNSTGSIAIPKLLERLGVTKIKLLNGDLSGVFAHNPEPLPEHLYDISREIQKEDYQIGFVVDPDVDRLAMVMENGEMFGEEYTLVAVADYVLQHKTGPAVSNLSSSRALDDLCVKYNVKCSKSAVGEVNVVEMMKEVGAVIGGEGNGGIIYPELHYGRDALVGIALILTYMAKSGKDCFELRRNYSNYYISKNKIELTPDMDIHGILNYIAQKYENQKVTTIDGVKIDFEDYWVHLRTSNTEPIIRIYVEALNESTAENIVNKIKIDIREFIHSN